MWTPVLAFLAGAAAALVVVVMVQRRVREGWAFEGRVKSLGAKDRDAVYQMCRSGLQFRHIMTNDQYKHLAKYDENAVRAECARGSKDWESAWKSAWKTEVPATCPHGTCTVYVLRTACLDKAKTKCCIDDQCVALTPSPLGQRP